MNFIAPVAALMQDQDVAFTFACAGAGGAELLVHGFSASESLFGLTQVDVELVTTDPDIDLHGMLDADATLTVHHKYAGVRHFSGVIAACSRGEEGHNRTMYSVTMLPALHRLAHGSDCKIFQQKTVPDIIKEVLSEYGVDDVKWDLTGTHVAREYCVQYRETHLAFIERIAAEEGIWYLFTHGAEGQHTLVFLDGPEAVPNLEDQPKLEYNATAGGVVKGVFCNRFQMREQLRSTSYMQRDYTFKNPPYDQQHKHQKQEDNGSGTDYALYDYPGRYKASDAGKPFTKHRMEATRVDATTASGRTNAIHLTPGHKMELAEHPRGAFNIKYHLLSVSHHGSQPQALGEEAGGGATTYSASFQCQPSRLPYKPPVRVKPMVDGPQIAHVTGPPGEEIYCDEHGRIKVWFPWDRHNAQDDKSSCWVRVSQNWGGASWGHIAIPRIGHEVIVDFLEGDPDQPIVTGRTYHNNNKPPYKLPDNKTKMVTRSDSHKGDGYNELTFEDEAGQENMFFHAQKDQTYKILDNRAKRVQNNQTESVGTNKNIDVGKNHAEKIGGSMNLSVGGGSGGEMMSDLGSLLAEGGSDGEKGAAIPGNLEVVTFMSEIAKAGKKAEKENLKGNKEFNDAGEHFTEAGKAQQGAIKKLGDILTDIMPKQGIVSTVIEKFKTTTIGLARTEQIGVYKNTTVGHTQTTQVGDTQKTTVGKEQTTEVGETQTIDVGEKQDTNVGQKKNTTVGEQYTVTVGGASMTMKSDGTISISGSAITISGSTISINGSTSVSVNGGTITSTAQGEHIVFGSLLKLN